MPVTLEEVKKNVLDDLQMGVIDEFQKSNFLLNAMTFDNVTSPVGGGSAMVYSYARLKTQPKAAFRKVNTEYVPHEVEKEIITNTMGIFGGSYQIDRVIADKGGIIKEIALQSSQKIKAASALFNDTVINGDLATDPDSFQGLNAALTGSSTDIVLASQIDLSSSAKIDTNWQEFQDVLDEWLAVLDDRPSAILCNQKTALRIQACGRRAGLYQQTVDMWGRPIHMYNGIPIVDLGAKSGTNDPIIDVNSDGTSDLYAVRFGLDGFHGICTLEGMPIKTWLPDYTTSGAVKTGEVEMIAGTALKRTKAAAKLSGIKVK